MKDKAPCLYFSIIEFGTPAYAESIDLRQEILRTPLGLTFQPDELASEWDSIHLGCYSYLDELLGCLVLLSLDEQTWKMRQVAVASACQGRGVGKQLVIQSEKMAREAGVGRMVLNARKTAIPFYQGLSYVQVGEPFTEVGLPHIQMLKLIHP